MCVNFVKGWAPNEPPVAGAVASAREFELAPVALAGLELEDDDLVARPVGDHGRLDRRTRYKRCAHHGPAIAAHHQHGIEAHGVADVGGDAIDHDSITFRHSKLLSAGSNDGKHGESAPGRDFVVYHGTDSGPLLTCDS